jgi:tetratricopeptide (TPR) repeat protein
MRLPKLLLAVGMLLCAGMVTAPAAAQVFDSRAIAAQKYGTTKARVIAGDLDIDWRAFRLAAAVGEVSEGFDWHAARERAMADLDAGNYDKALQQAKTAIDHNMSFLEGHLLAMRALEKLGKPDEAKKELAILNAIGKSIMESGDGNSAATAWFTVSLSETYFFLTDALGATFENQELVRSNGHAYDKLTVVDRQGKKRDVWFNSDVNETVKERGLQASPKSN